MLQVCFSIINDHRYHNLVSFGMLVAKTPTYAAVRISTFCRPMLLQSTNITQRHHIHHACRAKNQIDIYFMLLHVQFCSNFGIHIVLIAGSCK